MRNRAVLVLLFLYTAISCSDFVEVSLPPSQLTQQTVFEDPVTANAAVGAIYSSMRDAGLFSGNLGGLGSNLGLYTDELDFYRQQVDYFYTNALFAAQGDVKYYWNQGYSLIYAANAVISGIENSQSLTPQVRAQLKGEALFIRAFVHLYLNQLFGGVPYITTTDYTLNSNVARLPYDQCLEKVRADLGMAIGLLDNGLEGERVRPGKAAAHALMARACLYSGLWEEAAQNATAVIDAPGMQWVENLDQVFLKDSPSTIWQFMPVSSSFNTLEADLYIFDSGPPPTLALAQPLVEAFDEGDQRKELWTRAISDGTTTWYHPYKYKQRSGTGTSDEYSIVLRLAEQYLIRAEAFANSGNTDGALADLNRVRTTAGLQPLTTVETQGLLEAILAERRVELFTEFGHRFFDLQRRGALDASLQPVKPGWNTNDRLFPLPADEMLLNDNLTPQNPGY